MKFRLKNYIILLRPNQWIKNLLLFSPLFFAGNIAETSILKLFMGVISFCILSSQGYILNDWVDRKRDKYHNIKRHRPLCSGSISGHQAIYLSFILLAIIALFFYIISFPVKFKIILLCYFSLTISYSLYLKHVVLLELFVVSIGFVLRVLAGGAVSSISVSSWLFMTVFFISMLISVAKRLSEFDELGKEKAILHRVSQRGYSINYLTNMLWACGAITLVVYALYVVEHSGIVVYSVLPATYGVFRFIHLADQGKAADPIKILFTDMQLLLTTFFFLTFLGLTIYYP